jgi:hypothetical protein
MAEIIQLEGSECIQQHSKMHAYEDPNARHNRHGVRQNLRIQLTAGELESLSQEGNVEAEAVESGSEKLLGRYSIVGCNGQLDEAMVIRDGKYLLSGNICNELSQKGYVEITTPVADISILIKRN